MEEKNPKIKNFNPRQHTIKDHYHHGLQNKAYSHRATAALAGMFFLTSYFFRRKKQKFLLKPIGYKF